jgi:hypothetical protein
MSFQSVESVCRPSCNTYDGFGDVYSCGSGFSDGFDRPLYQEKVICSYFKALAYQYRRLYNAKGHTYPDLAAQGASTSGWRKGSLMSFDHLWSFCKQGSKMRIGLQYT